MSRAAAGGSPGHGNIPGIQRGVCGSPFFFSSSLAIESGKYNARDEIRNGEEAFIATGKVRFTMASASAWKVMTQVFFRPLFTKFASFHLSF